MLDRSGHALQAGLSYLVAAIGHTSKDPLYESEILLAQARASIAQEFEPSTVVPEGESKSNPELARVLERGRGFNENFYRKPIGWAVLLVVLIFFFVAWAFIELA